MKDSIEKIVEVLKEDPNTKFDGTGIPRSKLLGMITKIANTLPNSQIKTGIFLNEGILEKTNIKCRINLQKLLNVYDPDAPSYEDLFKKAEVAVTENVNNTATTSDVQAAAAKSNPPLLTSSPSVVPAATDLSTVTVSQSDQTNQ